MASSSLKVIALISGGKDSFFSMLHCLSNHHQIIALANLYPPPSSTNEVEDMDSFMYQTVGHNIIPLYAAALGLPLYRQEIVGDAVNMAKCYGPGSSPGDEAEALIPLLRRVMDAHPEVNAVSTGAILSDYQRTRVESVAVRLGLVPLAYLWQWPSLPPGREASLLEDMRGVGQDSRIIKVASGGLDERFLWENVAGQKTISRLEGAARRFGVVGDGAVLGEGGEYETLAVEGPAPLWKGRIVVDEADREVVSGEAGSAAVRLRNPRVVEKSPQELETMALPRNIPLFDARFEEMLANVLSTKEEEPMSTAISPGVDKIGHEGPLLFMPKLTGYGTDAATQTHSIMDRLSYKLPDYGHSFDDIVYTSIIVRDMADFAKINEVYGSYFTKPNPPARVTIACAGVLPEDSHLAIAITSHRREDKTAVRSGLHVQSRSYWAPANIGPYSQAITIPLASPEKGSIIYIAGQIPLVPASMTVVQSDSGEFKDEFARQTVLSLQHLSRIGDRVGARRWAVAIAFVVIRDRQDILSMCAMIKGAWSALHKQQTARDDETEAEDFDVWNTRNIQSNQTFGSSGASEALHEGESPPLYIVEVDALPRGCQIEWASYGLTLASNKASVDDIPHLRHLLNTFSDRILSAS